MIAGELQRVVDFDGATAFGAAAVIKRPTAVLALVLAQVGGELTLQRVYRPGSASSGCIRPEWYNRPLARSTNSHWRVNGVVERPAPVSAAE